jgi:hypothetical protein
MTEPEDLQLLLIAHVCARLNTQQVEPHVTNTHFLESANAADSCSTLWNARENYLIQPLQSAGKAARKRRKAACESMSESNDER